jgi:hypothetical protein
LVDDRSAGFYGVSGGFDFKGTNAQSAGLSREKYGQGGEYYAQGEEENEEIKESPYTDRSSLLTATLNSFAMFNIANILKNKTVSPKIEAKMNR